MSLVATEAGGNDFTMTPEGQYTARCYRIIDLGTQTISSVQYGTSEKHQVTLSWELFGTYEEDQKDETGKVIAKEGDPIVMPDGRPFSIHKTYTVSLADNSALRPHLEAWRGKKFTTEELAGFELGNLLSKYCTIQVVHSEDGKFANINSIMRYKGEEPKAVNTNVVFDIDNPDKKVFDSLSDNLKNKIANTPEWQAHMNPPKPTVTANPTVDKDLTNITDEPINLDDIPF